jgi:hypothetical protein
VTTPDTTITAADEKVDRAADKLQQAAEQAAAGGGLKAKLGPRLAEEAAFLRKLKPSLIVARARGEAPTDARPGEGVVAPTGPQLAERPKPKGKKRGGPNPLVVVGVALVAGILLAKVVDWRGHAHPRD